MFYSVTDLFYKEWKAHCSLFALNVQRETRNTGNCGALQCQAVTFLIFNFASFYCFLYHLGVRQKSIKLNKIPS